MNGPYKVTGNFELYDAQGNLMKTEKGKAVFLCRCGGSTTKPLCDGTHSEIGFKAAEAAIAKEISSP